MTPPLSLRHDWLASFVCFAEHLNFTQAARALHLSQPALHVQIAKLSEELRVPLYTRRGRSLVLTREGTTLLAYGRETKALDLEFVSRLHGAAVERPVVLSAGEGAYLYLLGEAVRAFSKPRTVRLRLLTRDQNGTVDAVQSGDADLGVAALDVVPDGVVIERLCDVGQVVVVPSSHRLARKRVVLLTDLECESLVVPPPGRTHRTTLGRALESAGVSWNVGAEANGWNLILHFAALGLGLGVVNGFCRPPKGMVARPLRGLPSIRYSLLSREGAALGECALRLKKLIKDKAAVA